MRYADPIEHAGRAGSFDIERDLICTADAKGYFSSLNSGWERLLGWTRQELMSRPFIDFVHPADRERTVAESEKLTRLDYEVVNFENRYRARGGGWRWLRWSARSDGETWFAVAFDITEEKEREGRLRAMLDDDHLLAYSQPILDQRRGSVAQEELLVRMQAPLGADGAAPSPPGDGTVISPSEFLPDAERCGLIGLVDRWMVAQGVATAGLGRRSEVNLSARSVGDQALARELEESIARAGRSAENLILEITETAALENIDAALDFAERLTRLGCRFALDDFGTGFSSLTYLRLLPVSYLKIDSSFVRNVAHDRDDQAMVRGIVAIARELGLLTVAEGVEDRAALELVRSYGVDFAQGFLIGRPAPLV
ncbi:MAG TPA: EAL domain-containing protein [Solirubrobacterales bacterium]|nr:EAL domain-containing protein [Solirubrobacterales bacterium]